MFALSSQGCTVAPGGLIGLTGGGGYLGRHLVAELLRQGFAVRASLRDSGRAADIRRSVAAATGLSAAPVEFVAADLLHDKGWEAAFDGCAAVIHAASPFPDRPPRDPRGLISLAADGTERVLRMAARSGISRVVVTSSIVAVTMTDLPNGRDVYDERDWSDPDDPRTDAYALSKLTAEQRAWALADALELAVTVINPGLIFGAPIGDSGATSVGVIGRFLRGRDPALPNAGFPCVDVTDVARAHVLALQHPHSIGQRLIVADETRKMAEIAALLGRLYPSRAIRTGQATDAMVRAAAKFDPVLQSVLPHLGQAPKISSDRVRRILGLQFRPVDDAITETARALMEQELCAAQ